MNSLRGTWRLVRLALRRDRVVLPLTILITVFLAGGSAPALVETYPDYETQFLYVSSSAPSAVGRVFQGTVTGVSLGTIVMAEVFLFTAVIMAVMSIFIITRHTRHNEESGAAELISSTVVGKQAPLTAALLVAIGANVISGVLIFAFNASLEELDVGGSAIMAAALALVGIFFAGVAAITAQLSDYRRGANMMAIGALVFFFIIRSFGDALGDISADGLTVTASWLTWLSPIGWGYQTLPYSQARILPLGILLIGFVVTVFASFVLLAKRDVGSSIFQARPGSPRAKASLLRTGGLAWRLQKGGVVGWTIGAAISGVMIGVVTNDFRETFEEAEAFQKLLASSGSQGSFSDTVFAAMFPLMGAYLAGIVVTMVSKINDEESSGRIEYLMGTAIGRSKWLATHIRTVVVGIVLSMFTLGVTGATSYVLSSDETDTTFGELVLAGMMNIPAMLLFFAVILIAFAISSKYLKVIAWTAFAYGTLIATFTSIFSWPDWLNDISPFSHTPAYPGTTVDYTPAYVMVSMSIVLLVLSVTMFKRRDLVLK